MYDRVWYLSVPKSLFDDAMTAGPFEFLISISFSFEYLLTNLLFVPFMSGAFTTQAPDDKHMAWLS
jgi:phenol hydroxylase P3 protein